MPRARTGLRWLAVAALTLAALVSPAAAADQLNAYSIWPENWARPMFTTGRGRWRERERYQRERSRWAPP